MIYHYFLIVLNFQMKYETSLALILIKAFHEFHELNFDKEENLIYPVVKYF